MPGHLLAQVELEVNALTRASRSDPPTSQVSTCTRLMVRASSGSALLQLHPLRLLTCRPGWSRKQRLSFTGPRTQRAPGRAET